MSRNRFGASNPAQAFATRVRWLVGALVVVILILLVSLLYIAQTTGLNTSKPQQVAANNPGIVEASQSGPILPTVRIIVAATRIDANERILGHMISVREEDYDRVPEGAYRADERTLVVEKYANVTIEANMPLVKEHVTPIKPVRTLEIPPGYRAVTIRADNRSIVEGWVKPGNRVDVLWTFTERGQKQVATLLHYVKVLSVGGTQFVEGERVQVTGSTTITLLVSEDDSRKVELARNTGALSLVLVGVSGVERPDHVPEVTTFGQLVNRPGEDLEEEQGVDGVMYTEDPVTGNQVKWVLRKGRWHIDTAF